MNKKNLLLVVLLATLGITVFDMTVSHQGLLFGAKKQKRRRGKKKQKKRKQKKHGQKGKVSKGRQQAMAAPMLNPSGRVSTLKANNSYTIGHILSQVRRNSPKSHFILGATGKGSTVIKGDPVKAGIDGSISAPRAGLDSMAEENSNLMVTLKADPALINKLSTPVGGKRRLNDGTRNSYQKILLYFDLNGYRFYVNDPYPANIVVGRVNPAGQIIGRW